MTDTDNSIALLDDPDAYLWVNVDVQIVNAIRLIRTRYNACTMRAVASMMHVAVSAVSKRCTAMRARGLVTFNEMHGSLDVPPTIETNGEIVWDQTTLPNALRQADMPAWHQAIVDAVINASVGYPASDISDDAVMAIEMRELLTLVPKPPPMTDEHALAIAHELEAGNAIAEPVIVLDTLDEALRLAALDDAPEVANMLRSDGSVITEHEYDQLLAEAASIPDSTMTIAVNRPVIAAQKAAARRAPVKNTKNAPARKQPPKPKAVRTAAEQAVMNERMAKLRAARG